MIQQKLQRNRPIRRFYTGIILLLALFAFRTEGKALTPDVAQFADSAVAAYTRGEFEGSIKWYEKILASGQESAAVYYNLGNAWFKLNEMAPAIFNYEKALLLAPGDEDILFNLKIANNRITDKIEVVPDLFFERWWKSFYNLFAGDVWAWLSLSFLGIFLTALATFILARTAAMRRWAFWPGMLFLVFAAFAFSFAWKNQYRQTHKTHAIVFSPSATAKSSPDASATDLFVLHEGTKVQVFDKVSGWAKIKLANGSVGWLPEPSLREF